MDARQRFATAFFIAAFIVAPLIIPQPGGFVAAAIALAGLVVTVGIRIEGKFLGALITENNVMSLSRFQAVLWTILIVAAFASILLPHWRDSASVVQAFNDNFTKRVDLFALMGISYASAVGSGMAVSAKSDKLWRNNSAKEATFMDIFEGDEWNDGKMVDISKMQMFFFTLIGAVVFISMYLGQPASIPQLPNTLIALMGISHAAYLGNKTVTRTTDAQATDAVAAQAAAAKPVDMNIVTAKPVTRPPQVTQ